MGCAEERGVVRRSQLAVVTLLAASITWGACSSGGRSTGSSRARGDQPGPPRSGAPAKGEAAFSDHGHADITSRGSRAKGSAALLKLEAGDFYFDPTYVKVRPGSTVKVIVRNRGKTTHTFTAPAAHMEMTLRPGTTRHVRVRLPADGVLVFGCRFHADRGMRGVFYSRDGIEGNPPGPLTPGPQP